MTGQPMPIGIAVVEWGGCYLVGIRGDDGPLPGFAEFPGGKCEPGESPAETACRECLEETGLEVMSHERLLSRTFDYPHSVVDLHFWLCRPAKSESVDVRHRGFQWVTAAELASLRFPEANRPVIEMLTARERSISLRANTTQHRQCPADQQQPD